MLETEGFLNDQNYFNGFIIIVHSYTLISETKQPRIHHETKTQVY